MSAAAASLAPRSIGRRPTSPATRSASVAAVRRSSPSGSPVSQLPSRYTVPLSILPSRSTFVRRRVGAAVFVVTLVLSVGSVAQRGLADRGGEPASAAAIGRSTEVNSRYVVRSGDTLWAIAERLYPGADIAAIVDALVSLNGGAGIEAGQTLNLP
jgi:nucleoid-associated protein YgaU